MNYDYNYHFTKIVDGTFFTNSEETFIIRMDKSVSHSKAFDNDTRYNGVAFLEGKLSNLNKLFILQIFKNLDSEYATVLFILGQANHYSNPNFVNNLILFKKRYLFNKTKDSIKENIYKSLLQFANQANEEVKIKERN